MDREAGASGEGVPKLELGNEGGRFSWLVRGLVLGGLLVLVGVLYLVFRDELTLRAIAAREQQLRGLFDARPAIVCAGAFVVYVVVTGLSLPGGAVLTLAYGWFLGFWPALVLVSFASTAGATVAFLISRYLFREAVRRRFGERARAFEQNLEREGAFYLFTLRLLPLVPFFAINAVMGLTPIAVGTFWWVSQLGMLPATAVYAYAGSTIPSLEQLADPSQLRGDSVRDWPGLVRLLERASRGEGSPTARRLWQALPAEARAAVVRTRRLAEVDEAARRAILEGLNAALVRPDFALAEPWSELEFERRADRAAGGVDRAVLTKVNRAILVAAFPDLVDSPRPILSWPLIGAFVLLGLFPLVVRKAIGRFRKRGLPDDDVAESRENADANSADR